MKRSAGNAGRTRTRKHIFVARSAQYSGVRSWRGAKSVHYLPYVLYASSGNLVHSVRIVTGRCSGGCVVRGFGLCDLNSLKHFLTRFSIVWFLILAFQFTNFVSTSVATNLCQCFVEVILGRPVNVCRLTD